jgi:hypothetical protein
MNGDHAERRCCATECSNLATAVSWHGTSSRARMFASANYASTTPPLHAAVEFPAYGERAIASGSPAGDKLIGTMKDLGTVPVMAYSLPRLRAFYPDGAWWTPCLMGM